MFFLLALVLGPSALNALGQQPGRCQVAFATSIHWTKQRGITKYRLQIADDEKFRNVFYDGRITGERFIVKDLFAGYYYWRIAPADSQTGDFSKPVRFFVSGGTVTTSKTPCRISYAGWTLPPLLTPRVP
jgi:hypothetical protein